MPQDEIQSNENSTSKKFSNEKVTRNHKGEKSHECKFCGKKFRVPCHLRRHLLVHKGKKHFECEICGKMFSAKGTLDSRVLTRTGVKRYKCNGCNKKLNQEIHLADQKKTHKGIHQLLLNLIYTQSFF